MLAGWMCPMVLGMTPANARPPSKDSPQPLGAASYVPAMEPDLPAFTAPETRSCGRKLQFPACHSSAGITLPNQENVGNPKRAGFCALRFERLGARLRPQGRLWAGWGGRSFPGVGTLRPIDREGAGLPGRRTSLPVA